MLFNSLNYLFFLPIVIFLYYLLPKKMQWVWLLAASYYFYMCWNVKYVILLFTSTFISWAFSIIICNAKKVKGGGGRNNRLFWLASGIVLNFGMLVYFKYTNFLIDFMNRLFRWLNGQDRFSAVDIILPMGISFFIFQSIGYMIDVYRGDIEAETNLARYALFLSFFPQLVAGPIERASNLIPQLKEGHVFDYERTRKGMLLIVWGLFQKIVIADRAAIVVDVIFQNYMEYQGLELAFAAVCFAIQIYCDFGGYTNIAIGTAEMLGIRLMENFNHPYFSACIKEFWSRWHISLSSWFRDYVYIPLGGNRCSRIKKYRNIMLVMLLSGLWHGAGFHFLIWGGLYGLYQITGDCTRALRDKTVSLFRISRETAMYRILQGIITFLLVDLAWIFFRAGSVQEAFAYIGRMITQFHLKRLDFDKLLLMGIEYKEIILLMHLILFLAITSIIQKKTGIRDWILKQNFIFRWGIYISSVMVLLILGIYGTDYQQTQFIYFQF